MQSIGVKLKPGLAKNHSQINRSYLMSLDPSRLLANFYIQAGLNSNLHQLPRHYGGWEEPDQQVRGNITGHYMSACALYWKYSGDQELKGRTLFMVDELARCQEESEKGWCGSIPPVYLERIAREKWVWAPHYNTHKTLMGLVDVYKYCDYDKAEQVADKWTDWFLEWTGQFDEEKMQSILDWETGGMMQAWGELYLLTKKEKYRTLMERYAHYRFFSPMLEGKDILTHTHANTTIPEAHGMAVAYLATGEEKYRISAEGYLEQALNREHYCTGGQTSGEAWIDKISYHNLGTKNQEHCTVYNLIRLCEYVMRWTPNVKYAEYIEKNILNGLMAHHRLSDSMNSYYLPLGAGVTKDWSTPEHHMTCCLGTTMQANASYESRILFENEKGPVVAQYLPFEAEFFYQNQNIKMALDIKSIGTTEYPETQREFVLSVKCDTESEFTLTLRVPAWSFETIILVNGREYQRFADRVARWVEIPGVWQDDQIAVILTPKIHPSYLSGEEYFAVMYGPEVLAGITDNPCCLSSVNPEELEKYIEPRAVNDWVTGYWHCMSQDQYVQFMPLHQIDKERYTVYFKNGKR